MILLITKMILAHFIGDFYLQPSSWVQDKEMKKHKSIYLYLHSVIHGLLVWVLLWDWNAWKIGLALAIVHFVIDLQKLIFQKDARLLLLDASVNVVGTGAWQSLTPGVAMATFTVNSAASATKGRIEAVAA